VEVVTAGGSDREREVVGEVLGVCVGVVLAELDECVSSRGYAEAGVGKRRSSAVEPVKVEVGVAPEV